MFHPYSPSLNEETILIIRPYKWSIIFLNEKTSCLYYVLNATICSLLNHDTCILSQNSKTQDG